MSNQYSGYTAATRKAFRRSECIICQLDGDTVYISNGYFVFKMSRLEYLKYIQPVTNCDAGNYRITNGVKCDDQSGAGKAFFSRSLESVTDSDRVESVPLIFDGNSNGQKLAAMYHSGRDSVGFYNTAYVDCIAGYSFARSRSSVDPVIFYDDQAEPFAAVLPVRCKDSRKERAARAYFSVNCIEDEESAADILRKKLYDKQKKLGEAVAQIDNLAARLRELETAQAEAQQNRAALEPAAMAESIASRWSQVDGIAATVKGAKTACPIVWLSGSVAAHAEAIEANGGRWSGKKSAYYFRVA